MTTETYHAVMRRDGACVAPRIDRDAGLCSPHLTVDHVRPEPGAKTISSPRWCVVLCDFHHLSSSAGHVWATSHRPELRLYLSSMYP